eukprot:EG_transcript_30677
MWYSQLANWPRAGASAAAPRDARLQAFAAQLTQLSSRLLQTILSLVRNLLKGTQHEETIQRSVRATVQKEAVVESGAALMAVLEKGALAPVQHHTYASIETQVRTLAHINMSLLEATKQVRAMLAQRDSSATSSTPAGRVPTGPDTRQPTG